jgi:hypothetical protein
LAAIVVASPVAGLRPERVFCAGLTRTVSCTSPPIRTFCAFESSSRATASSASRTRLVSALVNSERSGPPVVTEQERTLIWRNVCQGGRLKFRRELARGRGCGWCLRRAGRRAR